MKEGYTNWDEKASDLNDLMDWWKKDQSKNDPDYSNGHEWFMITCIEKEKFTDIIRALKEAEEKGFRSFDTSITEGKNGLLVLECNTAKESANQGLFPYILDKCDLNDNNRYAKYWEDCWDYQDALNLPLKEKCELVSLAIYSEEYLNFEMDNYENWDVRMTVRDIGSGEERELGGGYLSREQGISLWEDAKWLNRAEDYKEEMDPDIGYLMSPPEEDIDL